MAHYIFIMPRAYSHLGKLHFLIILFIHFTASNTPLSEKDTGINP